jgi:hypothetical protein
MSGSGTAPQVELLGREAAVIVDEVAAVPLEDLVGGRLRGVAVDVDHDHRTTVAQRALVRREIDELVHQREVERPSQPAEPARHAARAIHPVGTLLAAQDLEVARSMPLAVSSASAAAASAGSSITARSRLVG